MFEVYVWSFEDGGSWSFDKSFNDSKDAYEYAERLNKRGYEAEVKEVSMVGCRVTVWDKAENRFRWYHDGLDRQGAKALAKELEEQGQAAYAFDEDGWMIL